VTHQVNGGKRRFGILDDKVNELSIATQQKRIIFVFQNELFYEFYLGNWIDD
jgi:hypothetical protein